ncbi:(Fe-S)-binding protein [Symbioplanes lichenis]|uniref:(Fe-S)-binding protein n=1 Tax=Symbioplanes lichenis TaxID=1629072 RepID=UPI002738B17A|nr:heterodisulfide reductase-related iron-sulfur binding cluster [Actinoplanes lichenis]
MTELPDLLGDCVHCGFCLPSCPTYTLWGLEADSPRGRIHLMGAHLDGEPLSPSMVQHFDQCLGCMSCVTACPSGVQYDRLIEETRATVEREAPRTPAQRALRAAIFALFPYPRRLKLLRGPLRAWHGTGLARRLGPRLPGLLATLQSLAPAPRRIPPPPTLIPARGPRRAVVGVLTGCVQSAFFPEVNAATIRVLAAEGCDVVVPPAQGCCGALSVHNGRTDEARTFARRTVDTFARAGVDAVIANAAGCGSAMKDYESLLPDASAFTGRVRDLSEFLVELGPVAPRHPLPVTVAYHDACHLAHAQGIRSQPRQLLDAIPMLKVREIADPEICCGSAGIWNILNPVPAAELGARKAENVLATGADLLVTANPGCLMQIAAAARRLGRELPLAHTATVLDASIRGTRL